MTTRKPATTKKRTTTRKKTTSRSKREPGALELTGIDSLPDKAKVEKAAGKSYKYRYTTGPFLLPQNSGALDWTILNNAASTQTMRVTVFRCPSGAPKTAMPPGPLVMTIDPGETTHNANTYTVGFAYEIQVECNHRRILPFVSVWPGNFGAVMPGTGINSGLFLRRLP